MYALLAAFLFLVSLGSSTIMFRIRMFRKWGGTIHCMLLATYMIQCIYNDIHNTLCVYIYDITLFQYIHNAYIYNIYILYIYIYTSMYTYVQYFVELSRIGYDWFQENIGHFTIFDEWKTEGFP